MLNWLRSFLENVISNHQEKLYVKSPEIMEGILYFMASELSAQEAIDAANLKISIFQRLSNADKRNMFPAYYLDLEQIITEIDPNNRFTQHSLRIHIQKQFPDIQELEGCFVLFIPLAEQELSLAKEFLTLVLCRGANNFRTYSNDHLTDTKKWLDQFPTIATLPIPFHPTTPIPQNNSAWLDLFKSISQELYQHLAINFGKRHATRAFEYAYNTSKGKYQALESFAHVIELIPTTLMNEDKMNALSHQQINSLRHHQIEDLRETNYQLCQQNEELETSNQLLIASQRKTAHTLQQFEKTMQSLEEGIINVDLEGKILIVNEKVCDIWGYTDEELIGKGVEYLFPQKYANQGNKSWRNYLSKYKKNVLKRQIHLEGQDKNGRLFPLELSINEISSSQETCFTILLRDVTEELKREERLKQLNLKLLGQNLELMTKEQELGTINAELTDKNDQLEDTFLALSERNFELDQFVYRVSHDMRSPLSSLMGLINLIRLEKTPSQDSEYINMLEDQVHKLDTFLTSMLNFSKASRGQVQQESINFAQLIDDCLAEFEGHPYYYQLMVNVNIEGEDLLFYNDLTRMKIIVRNILSNAFEYLNPRAEMPYLHVYVKVSATKCRILFDDNGIGIHQKYLDKVFDMFYRATELSKGSGLGLYIVKQATHKLNGALHLESQERQGTKLEITIPNVANPTTLNTPIEAIEFSSNQLNDQRNIA